MTHSILKLPGCRHDILGHNLKAIGLLRTLAKCADAEHRDPDAEGWWDLSDGTFCLFSTRYNTPDALSEFFEKHYLPTPVFSAWNTGGGLDEKREVVFKTGEADDAKKALMAYLNDNIEILKKTIKLSKNELKKTDAKKLKESKSEYVFDLVTTEEIKNFPQRNNVKISVRVKGTGKKAVMVHLSKKLEETNNVDAINALDVGRDFFDQFQSAGANRAAVFEEMRDRSPNASAEAFDSIFTSRTSRTSDNPLFLTKGMAGQVEIFRTFWGFFICFLKSPSTGVKVSLFGERNKAGFLKDRASPFFPDAIKTYNFGSGWVEEKHPFAPLDYILAVEGAFALRGSVSRMLGANTRRFAAFPFLFDAGEDMVDDSNNIKETSSAIWLPLWERPTTYSELASFIQDAQAQLPKKDVRFSAEFLRALYVQGVDAGFSGWQEFRFRMRGSRVPWLTTGRYVAAEYNEEATLLNRALEPFDQSRFVDQFEIVFDKGAVSSKSPHGIRAAINDAIEIATAEPNADNCLEILCEVFAACEKPAISKTFRQKSKLEHPRFFTPLPMEEWNRLLCGLEHSPEFDIARAVASIVGQQKQNSGEHSKVLPMLGSLLPITLGKAGWYLPTGGDRSNQCVWTGVSLCRDLAAVLLRRHTDSVKDDYPALQSVFPARLEHIVMFLRGELHEEKVARWIEALSLIGWRFRAKEDDTPSPEGTEDMHQAIPLSYAALRTLLDLEMDYQPPNSFKRRRAPNAIVQLCMCSDYALAQATTEALRWLSIWGVPNPWGNAARKERERLSGTYIVDFEGTSLDAPTDMLAPERVAAAAAIPLRWQDRWQLARLVTRPISN